MFNEFCSLIDWRTASHYQPFIHTTLVKHQNLIDWDMFSTREDLTEKLLNDFSHLVNWNHVKLLDYSDDFLNKHKEIIIWSNVSFSNINRYEDYKESIDWVRLSYHEELTEDFMRNHQDLLDWNFLSSHQEMSEEFVQEFSDRVNIETRNFFNNRRNRRGDIIIRGIPPIPPTLTRQSRLRAPRPTFFEY